MAEVFAAETAKSLLGKLGSLVAQELCLGWRLEGEFTGLEVKLSAINAVLVDAEKQQSQNEKIRVWLQNLREVLYDAEDVLDEFQCETLRRQVVKTTGSTGRKVRRCFSSSNKFAFRLRLGHEIKNIINRLSEIASLKSQFNLSEQTYNDHSNVLLHEETDQMSRFFESFSGLIGRDKDKKRIIKLLIKPFKVKDAHPFVVPIVGMGGLGKTALVRSVLNHDEIKTHFELRMEVCVPDGFVIRQVVLKVIESATGERCVDLGEDQLKEKLEASLNGKKYLLVLDDYWDEDSQKWLCFQSLLKKGANGSKIIVTTRSRRVAEIVGTISAYNLSVLDQKDCFSLFYKFAFKEGQKEKYPNLVEIGKEIVVRCKQIPLAVINLGTQLYGKIDEREWKSIRDSKTWEAKKDGILPALKISYQRLPTQLKRCFLYCSIFPKGYFFKDLILVQFWMAHGLIQSSNPNENLEEVGFLYVRELISKCFFQDVHDFISELRFKMHDLMHDLASSLAQNECSMIIPSQNHPVSKTTRHLSVLDSYSFFHPKFPNRLDHVRTVLFGSSLEGSGFEKCLSEFKHLRALEFMDGSEFEVLPDRIGALKHLRYLSLARNSKMKRFPKSIFKLQNLQALVLGDGFEELPKDVSYLISLRLLILTSKQKQLPEGGIGCLGCLQILIIANCESLEYLCQDMQGLKSLRKLCIEGCKSLISLPRSMKYLTALRFLSITCCEKLDLMRMEDKQEGEESIPLSLQTVLFCDLPATLALPKQLLHESRRSLENFIILECPNIGELPEFFRNLEKLQKLEIAYCPKLSRRCEKESGGDWPKIAHIHEIYIEHINIQQTSSRFNGTSSALPGRKSKLQHLSCEILEMAVQCIPFARFGCNFPGSSK